MDCIYRHHNFYRLLLWPFHESAGAFPWGSGLVLSVGNSILMTAISEDKRILASDNIIPGHIRYLGIPHDF